MVNYVQITWFIASTLPSPIINHYVHVHHYGHNYNSITTMAMHWHLHPQSNWDFSTEVLTLQTLHNNTIHLPLNWHIIINIVQIMQLQNNNYFVSTLFDQNSFQKSLETVKYYFIVNTYYGKMLFCNSVHTLIWNINFIYYSLTEKINGLWDQLFYTNRHTKINM